MILACIPVVTDHFLLTVTAVKTSYISALYFTYNQSYNHICNHM